MGISSPERNPYHGNVTGSIVKGAWLGFSIAAPLGPIGALVLRQSLTRGAGAGLASGFGAASADLIFGLLAVAGVRLAAGYARPLTWAGALFLLYLAWRSWRETPAAGAASGNGSLLRATAVTFVLTLSNPMTIVAFAAMVAAAGGARPAHFVLGVFLGSMLWWTALSLSAGSLKGWLAKRGALLNRVAAVTLASFALWAVWSSARPSPAVPHTPPPTYLAPAGR
jgi:threonine/homoserine/homoserine lactone efflux protein